MKQDIFNKTKEIFGNLEKLPLVIKENDSEINNLKAELDTIIIGAQELQKQGDILKIGVVGQVKAGKSSFLNALIFDGKDILPKAVTPMTAGLTVLGYAEKPRFEAEFYNQTDWATIEFKANEFKNKIEQARKEALQEGQQLNEQVIIDRLKDNTDEIVVSAYELVTRCSSSAKALINAKPHQSELNSLEEWQSKLQNYVGADGEFTSVTKCLYLYLPDEKLKGIEIVDTPGVNDPVVSRGERTNEFLRSCHGVFMLSNAEQFCTSTDMTFLKERVYDQGIEAVVVLASKYDSSLPGIAVKHDGHLIKATVGLTNDLRKMLDTALGNKGLNVKPTLDHVSSICYNLYKKDKNVWSEEEIHIANQLIKRYPKFFTPEDEKYIFETLANIENIQVKYVKGEFTANKTKIIEAKQSAYIDKNKAKVLERLKSLEEEIESGKNTLENTESSDVDRWKKNSHLIKFVAQKSHNLLENIAEKVNSLDDIIFKYVKLEEPTVSNYIASKSQDYKIDSGYMLIPDSEKLTERKHVNFEKLRHANKSCYNKCISDIIQYWNGLFEAKKGEYAEILKTGLQKIINENNNIDLNPKILGDALKKTLKQIEIKLINLFLIHL